MELLTFGQLCALTGVKRGTMKKWLSDGVGPVTRWTLGGKRRFLEADIKKWIKNFSTERPQQQKSA
ncbi:MAG: helix-turn-helix domain-containing protein [Desulfomonilaceae bacterium]